MDSTILIFPTYNNLHKNTFIFFYFYLNITQNKDYLPHLYVLSTSTLVSVLLRLFFSSLMRCGESKIDIIILFIQNGFLAVHWKRICLTRKVQQRKLRRIKVKSVLFSFHDISVQFLTQSFNSFSSIYKIQSTITFRLLTYDISVTRIVNELYII